MIIKKKQTIHRIFVQTYLQDGYRDDKHVEEQKVTVYYFLGIPVYTKYKPLKHNL